MSGPSATGDELLARLKKLSPVQFDEVMYRSRVPASLIAGPTAPQGIRAIELIRYFEQQAQLDILAYLLDELIVAPLSISPEEPMGGTRPPRGRRQARRSIRIAIFWSCTILFTGLVVTVFEREWQQHAVADEQQSRCAKLEAVHDWLGLRDCANELDHLGIKDKAHDYADTAAREQQNELIARSVEQFLREDNLKNAQAALAKLGTSSVYAASLQRELTKAEAQALDDAVHKGQGYVDAGDCNSLRLEYKQLTQSSTFKVVEAVGKLSCIEAPGKTCETGNADACYKLAVGDENGVPPDLTKAAEHYRKACEGGNADGCAALGSAYYRGHGVPREPATSVPFSRKACDGGSMRGCNDLGACYQDESCGLRANVDKAAELFRRACAGGFMTACNNLGADYEHETGVPHEASKAVGLYEQACNGGAMIGCNSLGAAYQRGIDGEANRGKAAALYQKACEGGYALGCFNLGAAYDSGTGVPQNHDTAVTWYEKACNGGDPHGCDKLGVQHDNATGRR